MLKRIPLASSRALPILVTFATIVFVLTAGCGRNETGPRDQVPLTLRALAAGPGMAAHAARAADDTVTYSTMLLVVREVSFHSAESEAGDSTGDDIRSTAFTHASDDSMGSHQGDGEGEREDMESIAFHGPFVVDLLAQKADSLDTEMVPPGTYRSVGGEIGPLRASDWNASKFPFMVGVTVYLKGAVHGTGGGDFTYLASISHKFRIRGRFTVDKDTPATAFLTFDTSHWLRSPDGTFLDPRDSANDLAIRDAIIRSIRAGMDDDHDGRCDDLTEGEN